MITKNEIIELLKEYSGYIDRSRTEQAIHEDNFDIISDAILSKLRQDAVSGAVCSHKYGGIGICDSEDGGTCDECPYLKQTDR